MIPELDRLVALSPATLTDVNAAVRTVCADTVGLAPLPSEGGAYVDPAVIDFAEQFSADVSSLTGEQRAAFAKTLGTNVFSATVLVMIADFAPRVRAGLESLGVHWSPEPVEWDRRTDPADYLLNCFAAAVGRMRDLDPVTSEIVRLYGARQHNCRLCKSLREGTALNAGGSEAMYDGIDAYESSDLSARHKAALRYVDALIWTPALVRGEEVSTYFSEAQAIELTLDVMRNACNKIAVALGADAPRVEDGVERYLLGADGQPVYS